MTPSPLATYRYKIKVVLVVLCLAMLIILTQLYTLQIYHAQQFFVLGQKNFTRVEKVHSLRGNILDAHGKLLATNRPFTNLYWIGTGKTTLTSQQLKAVDVITQSLKPIDPALLATIISSAERGCKKVLLAKDLTFEQLSLITEQLPAHPQVSIETKFKRHYPHQTVACHLLGYLGSMDYEEAGKMGLEKLLEPNLKGEKGEVKKIINSLGKNIAEKELKQALAGQHIKTTINLNIQQAAEEVFPAHKAGCIVIMNPKNGALLAVVSRPNFDPTIFLHSISRQEWEELRQKKAFLNRAFDACYPPASLFKLISISAALEHGIISTESVVHCRGYYLFGNYKHWCMNHAGHGTLTITEAVAKSCNIPFFHIGKYITIDKLADYAYRFGLGQPIPMVFPNRAGLIPTKHWKLMTKHEPWWPGETLSAAIGQSFLLATPIQMACMIAGIFEGYLVTPRLLEHEPIKRVPLRISAATLKFLQQSMHEVVRIGTGIQLSTIDDVEIYAKTGTAQTSSLSLRLKEKQEQYLEHSWLVSQFRYKEEDPLVLVILVEHAGSSRVATTIAKNLILKYKVLAEKVEL